MKTMKTVQTKLWAVLAVAFIPLPPGPAPCTNEGSRWVAARLEPGGVLGCERAPRAVAWWLYTPPHRETVPHAGHTFVRARQAPRVLLVYGCTEEWLRPVALREVRTQGYVFDVTTARCR